MAFGDGTIQRKIVVRSDKDTHFSGALIQNAVEHEDIAIDERLHRTNEFVVEQIAIISDENLEWDVFFWSTSGNLDASDYDDDKFIEYQNFSSSSGKQIAAAGGFYYATSGLAIPYRDDGVDERSNSAILHVSLVNRSAGAKTAGSAGEAVVICTLRPVYGSA